MWKFVTVLWQLVEQVPSEIRENIFIPKYHNLIWHQHSVFRHIWLVWEAAARLRLLTGIDVTVEAGFHDLGKIAMFAREVETGTVGQFTFTGHEEESVRIARRAGLSEESQRLVALHGIAYGLSADEIMAKTNDSGFLVKLLAICAADVGGKGWTDWQRENRPLVAAKFGQICASRKLPDELNQVLNDVALNW